MRFLFHLVLFFSIALGLGFGLSYLALEKGDIYGTLKVGPWVAWTQVGVAHPDPYTRAYISRSGALELARAEGIKFVAKQDSAGQDLLATCTYRIDGTTPETSLWTMVAINSKNANITKPDTSMALRSDHINYEPDGSFALHIGPNLAPQNWLETIPSDSLIFVLTLYDSSVFSGFTSLSNSLPSIFKESCQ